MTYPNSPGSGRDSQKSYLAAGATYIPLVMLQVIHLGDSVGTDEFHAENYIA